MVRFLLFGILLMIGFDAFTQDLYKKNMDAGYSNFEDEDYEDARYYFQKAVDESPLDFKANYNLANSYFRLEDYESASELYSSFADMAPTNFDKAKAYHNLGNTQMMSNKLKEAIESYKQALRYNPSDEATRYNLAYAQELLKEQQQNQPQDSESQEGNEGEEGEEGDEGENSENNGNDENGGDENQEGNEGDQNDGNNPQNEEGPENNSSGYTKEMTKEEAERILKNAFRAEKKLQEKLDKEKVVANGKAQKKDW